MNFGADISAPMFNEVEFNQAPVVGDIFTLYVDVDGILTPVLVSFTGIIPANSLYPNSSYVFRRTGPSPTVEIRFNTPPSIAYDGLGG
jgi:hypothetical protein